MDLKTLIEYATDDIGIIRANKPKVERWDNAQSGYSRGLERMALTSLGRLLLVQEGNRHFTSDDAVGVAEKYMEGTRV